ncbi:efflux RND transporter periplasmic adaptor subunit [Sulfuriflexus mobilis]|uniref:efflux RND transporter periplasmic adaptor subunit n=1 Tax=Sulfuriflexus mobilis TaxID=1811807 RepID=UPI00155917FB|nr:efflux RND transporter periplasmic adaptor subunit [Sulfuriflexus mobilis]
MIEKSIKSLPRQLRIAVVIIGTTFLIIVLLLLTRPDKTSEPEPLAAVSVRGFVVKAVDLRPEVEVTGRLQPANRALLRFEVSGQLARRHVEPGQVVEKEALLLSLEEGDARDALAEAQANMDMERAAIKRDRRLLKISIKDRKLQENEVARMVKLGAKSLASASLLDQSRQRLLQLESAEAQLQYSVETATARLSALQAALARAQRNLARTELRAPFAGTVNTVEVEAGDYVTPASMAMELVDLAQIDFYTEVTGSTAAALHLQQPVNIRVAGREIEGQVIALRSDPDPSTFTHALRIRLPGEGLLPGGLATTRLPLTRLESVLAVPIAGVLQEEGRAYAFVIRDGQLERREVGSGLRHAEQLVITRGLRAGDIIVANDVAALSHGQSVRLSQ